MFTPALPTATIAYKGFTYCVNGEPPTTLDGAGRYFYLIKRKGRKPVQSEAEYSLVTAANAAARTAIDAFVAAKG